MRALFLTLTLLLVSQIAFAQCHKELQPTLRAYQIQQYGESYVNGPGMISAPIDSEICEKIRYELRVYHCRWAESEDIATSDGLVRNLKTDALGVPLTVKRAQARRANQVVGGEAAKQRSIKGARRYYQADLRRMNTAKAAMSHAKDAYLSVVDGLEKNSCKRGIFAAGKDPFVGPGAARQSRSSSR